MSENIDAVDALRYVDIGDREAVKTALGSVLVKDYEHQSAYEAVFESSSVCVRDLDVIVPGEGDGTEGSEGEGTEFSGPRGSGAGGGGGLDSLDEAGIHELLLDALQSDERLLLQTLARLYVSRHAGIQPGRAVAGTYYLFRAMRAVARTAARPAARVRLTSRRRADRLADCCWRSTSGA